MKKRYNRNEMQVSIMLNFTTDMTPALFLSMGFVKKMIGVYRGH